MAAITVVTKFLDKDTVLIRAYVYSLAGTLTDPTSVTIDIYDPDSTLQVDGGATTNTDTGIYDYYYHKGATAAVMDAGRWRGIVWIVDGENDDAVTSHGTFTFEVGATS